MCALGYFGSGLACQPWLTAISLNGVPLAGFSDNVFAYAVQYPINVQTVEVMVVAPADVTRTLDGQPLTSGVASAPIPVKWGENMLSLVASGPGVQATYTITLMRGEQEAYVKASNTLGENFFGYAVAMDGDTMVVSAPRQCGNAARASTAARRRIARISSPLARFTCSSGPAKHGRSRHT